MTPTDDQIERFRAGLIILFAGQQPKTPDKYPAGRMMVEHCRAEAFICLDDRNPRKAAYMACDTGAPNDAILSIYRQIFFT
jgi:hypothetical protein